MPVSRRMNDAQTERLLSALKSLPYRQELAAHVAAREGIQYRSAMRRLQRYITKSTETRSFARTSSQKQQILRQEARRVPLPPDLPDVPLRPPPPVKEYTPVTFEDLTGGAYPQRPVSYERPEGYEPPDFGPMPLSNADLIALVAYHDGDIGETVAALGLEGIAADRAENLLELTIRGLDITDLGPEVGRGGKVQRAADELIEAAHEFLDSIPQADVLDIQDMSALLNQGPIAQWMREMILSDIVAGNTTFADWLDAWRDDDMDIDMEDSAFWELWRAAYGRAKG